jgi:hypothetical protein
MFNLRINVAASTSESGAKKAPYDVSLPPHKVRATYLQRNILQLLDNNNNWLASSLVERLPPEDDVFESPAGQNLARQLNVEDAEVF